MGLGFRGFEGLGFIGVHALKVIEELCEVADQGSRE